jgi:hypothetical protein
MSLLPWYNFNPKKLLFSAFPVLFLHSIISILKVIKSPEIYFFKALSFFIQLNSCLSC